MEQFKRDLAGDGTCLCLRQVQKEHLQLQALRPSRVESEDAKSFARLIVAHGEAAAAIRKAIKASGVVVHVEPAEFSNILRKMDEPLISYAATRSHIARKTR